MAFTVTFIGALRNIFGQSKKTFDCNNDISIMALIDLLIKIKPDVKESLIAQQNDFYRLNCLILVNGIEISVLNGLDTKLANRDEITLIPVIHGG
ncbi:MAG: MoaD/ThiS family protein [Candidatus Bathyarchaeota archaeon]|nr:MoaD/ThiS family protein [Candidatus Bathyarchaeota archaeon]